MTVIGAETIRINLNFVARVKTELDVTRGEVQFFFEKLTQRYTREDSAEFYLPLRFPNHEDYEEHAVRLLDRIDALQYVRRQEIRGIPDYGQVLIFWIQPDLIVFNGTKTDTEKAVKHFKLAMNEKGVALRFQRPLFPHQYMLKLYETCHGYMMWQRISTPFDANRYEPSNLIARDTRLYSIHDVSSEWTWESDQAKQVSAKRARDSTADLTTQLSILQGRGLKSIQLHVDMDGIDRYVRIRRRGIIKVLKKQTGIRSDKAQREEERLLWALEFASRLTEAYWNWHQAPVENYVVSPNLFIDIQENVRERINPILENALQERLNALEELKERIAESEDERMRLGVEEI